MQPPHAPSTFPPSYYTENNSAPLLHTCIIFLVLETLFIILLYTSRYLSKEKHSGTPMNILLTTAYFACVGKISLAICMIHLGGAGQHLLTLPPHTLTRMQQMTLVLQILCPLATSLTKLGILLLLHRILASPSRAYTLIIRTTFILVLLIMLIQFIIPFVNCRPFAYNWDKKIPGGKCTVPGLILWRYLSVPNIVTTFGMILIPFPALYKLRVSVALKLGLGVVFAVCLLGVVAAIMRFNAFLQVRNFRDITFEIIGPLSWTLAESGIYLIAGVMPTLRPLVRKIAGEGRLERLLKSWTGDKSEYKGSSFGVGNANVEVKDAQSGKMAGQEIERKLEFKISVEDYDDARTARSASPDEDDERQLVGSRRV